PAWPLHAPAASWGAVLYNSFVVFGLVQVIWFRMASTLPPVASGLSLMLIPVTGLFTGALMLGERITWLDLAALLSILLAMATVLLPARRR
ncbi:MAG: EamA family transporter, partial [Burkholderiaceae bacterium]